MTTDEDFVTLCAMTAKWVLGAAAGAVLLAGCGSDSDEPEATAVVTSCSYDRQNNWAVGQAEVLNSSDTSGSFAVVIKFLDGSRVLGTGEEWTTELEPGQSQEVRAPIMENTSAMATDCEIESVTRR